MTDFAELTRFIVRGMVSDPDAVSVQTVPRGRTTIIEVEVGEADKGKLIGKSGRNIDAVRAVVRAAGLRDHQRIQVELAGRR
ncbi:MAG TPA: KH domain-containing protein [Candidatus Binatia bacterium]|nr:KH domain-containing protein [Candidatus Binatia bacterium]